MTEIYKSPIFYNENLNRLVKHSTCVQDENRNPHVEYDYFSSVHARSSISEKVINSTTVPSERNLDTNNKSASTPDVVSDDEKVTTDNVDENTDEWIEISITSSGDIEDSLP